MRRVYDLRHTFATFALRADISTFDLSRYMGASLTMIDRHYGHLARDGREHAIRLLEELSAGQRPRWTPVDADMRVVFTTSEEEGPNGALLPPLEELLPTAYANRIDRRGIIDSLADPDVSKAIASTGQRQLITAGIGTEVCGVAPALHAYREGYQVFFVADACGSATALGHDISLRRLEQVGLTVTTTAAVSAELAGDYPTHSLIMHGG
jgi:Isochorismatase family